MATKKTVKRKSKPKPKSKAKAKAKVTAKAKKPTPRAKAPPIRKPAKLLHLRGPKSNRWVKCVAANGNIRAVAIEATELVYELAHRHKLSQLGARGLGEAILSAALIAASCKGNERVNLNIQGDGAFSQGLVDATADGIVRGYVIERSKYKPEKGPDAAGPWGMGLLSVLRTKNEGEQPYIGTVPLVTGHLAKDLTFYWYQSEQIPSAVCLGVYTNKSGIVAAGGFLVQAMPGADESHVKLIQSHILRLGKLTEKIVENGDPVQLLAHIFDEVQFTIVDDKPIQFKCKCSQERVERSLALLGVEELSSILKEDKKALVTCDFCSTDYLVNSAGLKRLISSVKMNRIEQD